MQIGDLTNDMRTTLDLDDDVLASAKEIARRENTTAGRVVSDLVRRALTGAAAEVGVVRAREPAGAYGFKPFASRGKLVTRETIDRLREEGEY
jgi:Arc/MetJ family transcription regulator